ncbi:MAG: hypothetical protein LBJ45_02985 [Holosporaceae bacterium]|nr:hypothetical protein [Holosporaceae bacterium]
MRKFLLMLVYCCLQAYDCGANEQEVDSSKRSTSSENNISDDADKNDSNFFRTPSYKNIYDQVAKQLAGLSDDLSSADHANFISEKWNSLRENSLLPISNWAQEYLTTFVGSNQTVFYPFGGPDIAHAIGFFPTVQNYVLVGLEPIGNFDSIRNAVQSEPMLASIRRAISYYLQHGFFITHDMMTHLSNKNTKGGLCLILLELSKLGFTVDYVENISLNSEGMEVARRKDMLNCVKITFHGEDANFFRNVYYLRVDLQNSRSDRAIGLKKFLKRAPFVTLVKSASYAMHDLSFSKIRDFILSNTKLLLQDDSGIPFRYFNSSKWEKHIFGEYTNPTLKVFQKNKQADLADYYAAHEKIEIHFKMGYGYGQERPNLLLAVPMLIEIPVARAEARSNFSQKTPDFVTLAHNLMQKAGEGGCSCKRKTRPPQLPPIPPVEERFLLPIPPDTIILLAEPPLKNGRTFLR